MEESVTRYVERKNKGKTEQKMKDKTDRQKDKEGIKSGDSGKGSI